MAITSRSIDESPFMEVIGECDSVKLQNTLLRVDIRQLAIAIENEEKAVCERLFALLPRVKREALLLEIDYIGRCYIDPDKKETVKDYVLAALAEKVPLHSMVSNVYPRSSQ